jgi:hypothetical protein
VPLRVPVPGSNVTPFGSAPLSANVGDPVMQTFTLIVPSFTLAGDHLDASSADGAGSSVIGGWATNIVSSSTPIFRMTVSNPELFTTQPTLSSDGTLTFQTAPTAQGSSTVRVWLDDGSGQDLFGPLTFTINVSPQIPTT